MEVNINLVAVLVASIVSMALGFLWYSPMMFAKPWMKLMGYSAESMKKAQKEMGKMYGISFVLSLLTAYVMAHVMALSKSFYHYSGVTTGMTTAFWMWLGFVMPVQATSEIFGSKKWNLLGINTGYQLVSLLGMGVVLGLF